MKHAWMKTALVALTLSVAGGASAAAQDTGPPPWAMAEIILQTNADYPANQLQSFLSVDTYTSSIVPGLLPADSNLSAHMRRGEAWDKLDLPELRAGLSLLAVDSLGSTVFSLTVVASSEKAAAATLARVVEHLEGLRSMNALMAGENVTRAEDRVTQAEMQLDMIESQWNAMREECQGLDPQGWLEVMQSRLQEYRSRHWELSMNFAVERGLREHFAARLTELVPTITMTGRMIPNPAYNELLGDLMRLKKEYEIMLQEYQDKSNKSGFDLALKSTMRKLADLEAQLETTPDEVPGPATERPSPAYQKVEGDLLHHEQKLAEFTAQLAALQDSIETITAEVLKFQKLADTQGRLGRRMEDLHDELHQARAQLANATRDAARFDRPAVQVVAGPNVMSSR